ncbi:MAG TPA: heavy-metal-associated domain-containing protein [Thermoanaerobaculia bacterium]|nr:heavy-metal-associated domain-containing protein [Thermoanaerobaculia bacterium]
MEQTTLRIDGMSCGHCVSRVQKALSRLEGVHVDQVEIGSARVTYDPERAAMQRIREAVEDAGYAVRPATEGVA